MAETDPLDITTASTKALADMDMAAFKKAVTELAGPKLQKFHQLRKLPDDKDVIVRAQLRELGLDVGERAGARGGKTRGTPLGWGAFGAVCLLTPVIGFFLVRWLMA